MISQQNSKSWRNPWFFVIIGVVLTGVSVNGVMVWWALQNNRSTFVDHEYNTKNRKSDTQVISEIESQNALAWKTSIKPPQALIQHTPAAYEIDVLDKAGVPVSGELQVQAYRASDASKDFIVPFKEVTPGKYQGYINFPLKGYWELRIQVKRGKESFETESGKITVAEAK